MNLKIVNYILLFSFSYLLNAQNLEVEYLQVKGAHEWERTMLKVLAHYLYQDPTSNANSFIRTSKIKTVKKVLSEIKRDSSVKERFLYEIKYDHSGNLISERTINCLKTYTYNEDGFLIKIQSKKTSNEPTCYIATFIPLKEKKIWSNEFICPKLQEHIFINKDNEIFDHYRYTYLKNDLLSKIEDIGSSNQVLRFYTYEYEFYE